MSLFLTKDGGDIVAVKHASSQCSVFWKVLHSPDANSWHFISEILPDACSTFSSDKI